MKRYALDEDIYLAAEAQARQTPIRAGSHRKGAANQVGILGEVIAEKWFGEVGVEYKDEREATTHDYRFSDGMTIEIKTKDRTVPPRPDYECSVPLYNHEHQACDYYLFVSLQRDKGISDHDMRRFRYAHVLGAINQEQLNNWGRVWKRGQVDPSNGTKFWTDCINVRIDQLVSLNVAAKRWRGES